MNHIYQRQDVIVVPKIGQVVEIKAPSGFGNETYILTQAPTGNPSYYLININSGYHHASPTNLLSWSNLVAKDWIIQRIWANIRDWVKDQK